MDESKKEADPVYIEWNPASKQTPHAIKTASIDDVLQVNQASIRTVIKPDGWKLCLSDHDKSQLFNLRDDPVETANLFYSNEHNDVIKKLTKKIQQWQVKTNDSVEVI